MKKNILLLFNIFIFLFTISSIFAVNVEVKIVENSTLTKLLSGSYSIDAIGTIEIYNPSNISKVYEFNMPLNLDSLVGISKISNSSSTASKFSFSYQRIKGYLIGPNETISTDYRIYGLLNSDIQNQTSNLGKSFLEYYIDDFEFSTNIILNLQKPQREGFEYNQDLSLNSSPITNTTRLITTAIRNPTDYVCIISEMSLFKSSVSDPFFKQSDLVGSKSNLTINAFNYSQVDFFDYDSDDYSIYWLSSKFSIKYFINTSINFNYVVQPKVSTSSSSSSGSRSSGGGSYVLPEQKLDSILVKKGVDKTIITNGAEFEVILRVVNINDFKISNLILKDIIPEGYELKEANIEVKKTGDNLEFKIDDIEAYDTYIIRYTLINNNLLKGITYLKPAELFIDDQIFYSDGVLVINDLLTDKKVFIQKEVEIIDDDYSRITIRVKNLGTIKVEDLLIVENLDENTILKEISKVFYERGSWKISSLDAGEEWTVTYLAERTGNLDSLPNIFGLDESEVFGTIISSEEVITIFNEQPRTIEKVGMGLAVSLLVFYLLF